MRHLPIFPRAAFVALYLVSVSARADDDAFFTGPDDVQGWSWYRDPAPPKEAVTPAVPAPAAALARPDAEARPLDVGPAPMTTAWFRDNIKKYLDHAIDDPTPQNVQAYYYLQRAMMDKASKFTEVASQVVDGDPNLDENVRRPLGTFAAETADEVAGKNTKLALGQIAQKAGIMVFFRSDCPYCAQEAPILLSLSQQYGFSLFPVSTDGRPLESGAFPNFAIDRGQAASSGVQATPAIFLAVPPTTYVPLAQGALTLTDLEQRIVQGAHAAGLIDEDTFKATQPVQDSTTLGDQKVDQSALSDPEKLVEALRGQMGAGGGGQE